MALERPETEGRRGLGGEGKGCFPSLWEEVAPQDLRGFRIFSVK